MNIFDLFQIIGGVLLSFSYIPQIRQNYLSKSVGDLNINFWCILLGGLSFMAVNAIYLTTLGSYTYAITQTVNVILCLIVVFQIFMYRKKA